jgi:hypothetical protein
VAVEVLQKRVTLRELGMGDSLDLVVERFVQLDTHQFLSVAGCGWLISAPVGVGNRAINSIAILR